MDMNIQTLKSVKGGYKKEDVLAKIDAYTIIIVSVESGADPYSLQSQFYDADAIELRHEKTGFFGKNGFSEEDSDKYLAELREKAREALGL